MVSVQYFKVKLLRMLQSIQEVDSFVPIGMKEIDPPVSSKRFFQHVIYIGNVFTQNTRSMVQFAVNAQIKVPMFVY